jgi:hypothetical protein
VFGGQPGTRNSGGAERAGSMNVESRQLADSVVEYEVRQQYARTREQSRQTVPTCHKSSVSSRCYVNLDAHSRGCRRMRQTKRKFGRTVTQTPLVQTHALDYWSNSNGSPVKHRYSSRG